MTRDEVPARVATILSRPVRWAPVAFCDDGCERTLQVFNAEVPDQMGMLRRIEPHRAELETAAGGPVIVMFLSRKQSIQHSAFIAKFDSARRRP